MSRRPALLALVVLVMAGCGSSAGDLDSAERAARRDAVAIATAVSADGRLEALGSPQPQLALCYSGSHPVGVTATYVYDLRRITAAERASAVRRSAAAWPHDGWKVVRSSASTVTALNGARQRSLSRAPDGSIMVATSTACIRTRHPERLAGD